MPSYMKNKKRNKSLIVSPYLDHLGGGERYMLEIARILEDLGHEVTIAWDNAKQITNLAKRQGITLSLPKLNPQIKKLYFHGKPFKMLKSTKKYDLIFYLSDGSIPLLGGKKNIIHFQVPFQNKSGHSILNRFKMTKISDVIVNSNFTKKIIDKEYGIKSQIIYPPVDLMTPSKSKQNIILSVGRFEPSLNVKKQNILIEAFKLLTPTHKKWKLILAGAAKDDALKFIKSLKDQSDGFNIEIVTNISHVKLRAYYQKAAIYWHAAGYGVNEEKNPELTEHFGITTVEAISAGCVPLVIPKGGQKEIVNNPAFHWLTPKELAQKTDAIIKAPRGFQDKLADISVTNFSVENFAKQITALSGR